MLQGQHALCTEPGLSLCNDHGPVCFQCLSIVVQQQIVAADLKRLVRGAIHPFVGRPVDDRIAKQLHLGARFIDLPLLRTPFGLHAGLHVALEQLGFFYVVALDVGSVHRARAALDAQGNVTALHMRLSGQSIMASINPNAFFAAGRDPSSFQGLNPGGTEGVFGYAIPNLLIDHAIRNPPVPAGFWRVVNNNQNALYLECFIDELAKGRAMDKILRKPETA